MLSEIKCRRFNSIIAHFYSYIIEDKVDIVQTMLSMTSWRVCDGLSARKLKIIILWF